MGAPARGPHRFRKNLPRVPADRRCPASAKNMAVGFCGVGPAGSDGGHSRPAMGVSPQTESAADRKRRADAAPAAVSARRRAEVRTDHRRFLPRLFAAMGLAALRRMRTVSARRAACAFERQRNSLSASDAHRHQCPPPSRTLQLIKRLESDDDAGRPNGMAEGNGAPIWIDP